MPYRIQEAIRPAVGIGLGTCLQPARGAEISTVLNEFCKAGGSKIGYRMDTTKQK